MTSNTIYHIQSSAAQNNQLLSELAQVEYAPSALQQQQVYIKGLQDLIVQKDEFLKENHVKLNHERYDYEKYKNSAVRRFAHKFVGKGEAFEAKASKEEREYFDAVQEDNNAKSQREMLAQQLAGAETTLGQFQQATTRHSDLKAQLDALYNSIFAGPTPDFPEEDAKEWPVTQAQVSFGQIQTRVDAQSQAVTSLQQARQSMDRVLADIKDALSYSTADMWGGGTWTDISERNSLSRAEMGVSQVHMLVQQAQRTDPSIQSIGPTDIVHGHIMSDMVFDNIFTDAAMHDKIEDSKWRLNTAAKKLDQELAGATARRNELDSHAKQAAQVLENARSDLQRVRQEAFERVAAGGQTQQQQQQQWPPSYGYGGLPPQQNPPSYDASGLQYQQKQQQQWGGGLNN